MVNHEKRECIAVLLGGFVISLATFVISDSQPSWVCKLVLHGAYCLYLFCGFPEADTSIFLVNAAYYVLMSLICWRAFRRFRPITPTNPNACLACHYDLTGNESGTCPECGTAIEPVSTTEVAG